MLRSVGVDFAVFYPRPGAVIDGLKAGNGMRHLTPKIVKSAVADPSKPLAAQGSPYVTTKIGVSDPAPAASLSLFPIEGSRNFEVRV